MCYSAQVDQSLLRSVSRFRAQVDLAHYAKLFQARQTDARIKIPRGMEDAFAAARTPQGVAIWEAVQAHRHEERTRLQQALFAQRQRLADAQRALARKVTKSATESQRIATQKLAWLQGKLADLARTSPQAEDSRIYPGSYAPVMVWEQGQRRIKPMRYQCRPAGKPASYDTRYPGTYNARRDNLEGFWKGQFGVSHGVMLTQAFYEHVSWQRPDGGGEDKRILEFRPQGGQDMLVAVLWSEWQGQDGTSLLSFAAITDEPPAEIAAAGHDRCIIPIQPEFLDDWLQPEGRDLAKMYEILDQRERPYYEYRLAA